MSKEFFESSTSLSKLELPLPVSNMKRVTKKFLFIKRCIDITFAILGLIISTPVFIGIRILYLFGESKGPIFFRQLRYGENGNLFYIYKFRSMIINADERLKHNKLLYDKYVKNNYKLEQNEDPRITSIGRFLRKTSIDELPQLINVLKGEMSIVGPRPVVEEELMEYKYRIDDFLSVKPGITGYWQVSGRSEVGYPERVNLELYYVYNQSFFMDMKILFKTIVVVFLKKGAY